MDNKLVVKVNEHDNVAIAIRDLTAGEEVAPGVFTREPIPQAHKVTLVDIPKGGKVIRYGVVLGTVFEDSPAGTWINEDSLKLPIPPPLNHMQWGTNVDWNPPTTWTGIRQRLPSPPGRDTRVPTVSMRALATTWGFKPPCSASLVY